LQRRGRHLCGARCGFTGQDREWTAIISRAFRSDERLELRVCAHRSDARSLGEKDPGDALELGRGPTSVFAQVENEAARPGCPDLPPQPVRAARLKAIEPRNEDAALYPGLTLGSTRLRGASIRDPEIMGAARRIAQSAGQKPAVAGRLVRQRFDLTARGNSR